MNQMVQPTLSPAAQQILSEVDFLPGEALQYSIQGDGFFIGNNPLLKVMATVSAMLVKLTGGHIRVFIMITNQRILLLQSQQAFCGFKRVRNVNAIALASLAEAGWSKDTVYCCIHARTVHMESKTQRHTLVIKNLGDPALREFVAMLSGVMVTNSQLRTAT
jgi:hypothetical protein